MKRLVAAGWLFTLLVACFLAVPCFSTMESAPVYETTTALYAGGLHMLLTVMDTGETSAEPGDIDSIYELRISGSDGNLLQTLRFPYASGLEMIPLLQFADLNSDGYLDIQALHVSGVANQYSTYFLYNSVTGQFEASGVLANLSNYQIYPVQKLILNYEQDSAATGVYTLFRFEDGQPFKYREASILYDEKDDQLIRERVVEYDTKENETVLQDVTYAIFTNEAEWAQRYEIWMTLLWSGLDSAEVPLNTVQ